MRVMEVPDRNPAPNEVLVNIEAAGVDYMDVGTRDGMYSIAPLPMTPGVEGAGRIAAVGDPRVDGRGSVEADEDVAVAALPAVEGHHAGRRLGDLEEVGYCGPDSTGARMRVSPEK